MILRPMTLCGCESIGSLQEGTENMGKNYIKNILGEKKTECTYEENK